MSARVGSNLTYTAICEEDGDVLDISAVQLKQILFKKPVSGDTLTKTGTFVTDGTDGQEKYQFAAGELDEAGTWRARPYVEFDDDNVFYGEWKTFEVKA